MVVPLWFQWVLTGALIMLNSIYGLVVVRMLMTYLTEAKGRKLIDAAIAVNTVEGLSALLSIPSSMLKQFRHVGCYQMLVFSSIFQIGVVAVLKMSAMSGKSEDNMYIVLCILGLGRACHNSSYMEDILKMRVKIDEKNNSDLHTRYKNHKKFSMLACKVFGILVGLLLLKLISDWESRYNYIMLIMYVIYIGYFFGTNNAGEVIEMREIDNTSNGDEEVRVTKILSTMGPICFTFLIYGVVKSMGSTFFLEQAKTMNRGNTSGISLPVLVIVMNLSRSSIKHLFKLLFNKRLRGAGKHNATLIRIGAGMTAATICCAFSRVVESERLDMVEKYGLLGSSNGNKKLLVPMSVYRLLPQFVLLGAMKGLAGDGMEGFFRDELPKSKKVYASAVATTLTGIGTLITVALILISVKVTHWFGNAINESHLDRVYTALTVFCLPNLLLYAYVVSRYTRNRVQRMEGVAEARGGTFLQSSFSFDMDALDL